MNHSILYLGLDVHLQCIRIAIINAAGKLVNQRVIETSTQAVRDVLHSLRGQLHVTFEESTHAAWLYDVISPLVEQVVVCNPKHNKLLLAGSKSDRIDAQKLAELLRLGALKPVYHGEHGTRTLKQLMRSYECFVSDITRVKNRLKALYHSQAIRSRGRELYHLSKRQSWIERVEDPGRRLRAALLFRQLDELKKLKQEAQRAMIAESKKHHAYGILRQVPELGPVRVAGDHVPPWIHPIGFAPSASSGPPVAWQW